MEIESGHTHTHTHPWIVNYVAEGNRRVQIRANRRCGKKAWWNKVKEAKKNSQKKMISA